MNAMACRVTENELEETLTVTLRAGTPVPKATKMHFWGTSQP